MPHTKIEHIVNGLEESTFVFWLLEIRAILGLDLKLACHRHGGHLLWSGKSQWSYAKVNPILLHVWPNLAEAASKANFFSPHTAMKIPCSHRRKRIWWSSAWHIWRSGLGASVGKRSCFGKEGYLYPHAAPKKGAWAPAEIYFSKPSLPVDWPVGRSRVSRAEIDTTRGWLV